MQSAAAQSFVSEDVMSIYLEATYVEAAIKFQNGACLGDNVLICRDYIWSARLSPPSFPARDWARRAAPTVGGNRGGPNSAFGATASTLVLRAEIRWSPALNTLPTNAIRKTQEAILSLSITDTARCPSSVPAADSIEAATSSPASAASVTSSANDAISTGSRLLLYMTPGRSAAVSTPSLRNINSLSFVLGDLQSNSAATALRARRAISYPEPSSLSSGPQPPERTISPALFTPSAMEPVPAIITTPA